MLMHPEWHLQLSRDRGDQLRREASVERLVKLAREPRQPSRKRGLPAATLAVLRGRRQAPHRA